MQTKALFIGILLLTTALPLYPQETARERIEQRRQQESVRQQPTNRLSASGANGRIDEAIANAKWSRIIYRYLDLTQEENAPLHHAGSLGDSQASLFTHLFRLLQDDAITVYEYLDGRELFTEEHQIQFAQLLDRFDIYHEMEDETIVVHDADIPTHEVMGYYVKEVYYFDTPTSSLQVRPLALCPILYRQDDYTAAPTRYPLFWVPYAELEPHARKIPVMSSPLNNSLIGTVHDFFVMRKYNGEIYKAQNARNLAISQYTSTPEEMKAEQDRIEKELQDFEEGLWQQQQYAPSSEQSTIRRERRRPARSSSPSSSVTMRDRRY